MTAWTSLGLVAGCIALLSCSPTATFEQPQRQALGRGETHPYQARLVCERAPGSTLVGVMYDITSGSRRRVAEISSGGNVGACELAIRASRSGRVCVPGSYPTFTILDLASGTRSGSYRDLASCTDVTRGAPTLETREGYVDFIAPTELAPFLEALPTLADTALDDALHDARTIWYDDASRVFVYQDSFGNPKGLRANRVGYDVGSNASEPDIHLLVNYFEPQKFKFPFAITAGATFEDNVYALYFWQPPRGEEGHVLPVKIWRNNSHYQWVFPVGTLIGEALFIQAPDDQAWLAFEVRTRVRELDRWQTSVFRPYASAAALAEAVRALRPEYASQPDVAALVAHLEATDALTPHTMHAEHYEALFPDLEGAMDYLPEVDDVALVRALLTTPTFVDTMGTHWKAEGELTTFAASTHARFHIVPAEYPAGMFELSDASCRRCHEQTSRPLNNLDDRVVLYGEVWGEDEVFTWHPFEIDVDTFSVADGNRAIEQRLLDAELIEMGEPAATSELYRALPKPYRPDYE